MASDFNADSAKFKLELDASDFQRNTKRAKESFSAFADKTVGKIQTVRQQFTNYLVNDLAGNAIKGAFEKSFEYLSNFANESKELVKIADAANLPVEALSELQAVAKGAEVDLGALADAAAALNFDALQPDAGKLGLNLGDLEGKGAAERLAAVLDALNKLPDATDRAAIAARVFGDSAQGLNAILDGTSGSTQEFIDRARDAGLIANEDAARGAAAFADALAQLKDVATGVANAFAVAILPAFKEGAEMLTEIGLALSRLSSGTSDASHEIDRLAKAAENARDKGDELRKLDAEKFKFAEDLAGQGALVESTFDKAASIIEELQSRYGELGFSVDKAARSIELATGAQEKFNAAAKANERAELEKEIAASEAREKDLRAREQEKVDSYGTLGGAASGVIRSGLHYATGGAVDSASEKWSKEVEQIGDEIIAEREKLTTLRRRLKTLNESETNVEADPQTNEPETPTFNPEKPTAPNLIPTNPAFNPTNPTAPNQFPTDNNESPAFNPTIPTATPPIPTDKNENPAFNPAEPTSPNQFPTDNNESPAFNPTNPTATPHIPTDKNENPAFNPAEPTSPPQIQPDKNENPAFNPAEPSASIRPQTNKTELPADKRAAKLDAEIAQFETRVARASQTAEQNRIDDARKEESDYREKLEERIVEERSKGKSGQDAALIETLQSKIEESTKREAERVELIEQEIDERKRQEAEKELKEGGLSKNVLATPLEGQEAALSEGADELTSVIAERLEKGEKPTLEDDRFAELLEDPDYFERAYQAAEETVKGTAATFSAFDAANAANGQTEELALKEAERQTRVLENIERAIRNQTATFA